MGKKGRIGRCRTNGISVSEENDGWETVGDKSEKGVGEARKDGLENVKTSKKRSEIEKKGGWKSGRQVMCVCV